MMIMELPPSARGQVLPPTLDTTAVSQQLSIGVSRIAFTSVFHGDAAFRQAVLGGILSLQQQYRGASLLVGTVSFRDDELFRAEWRYAIHPRVSIVPRVEWDVSNDTRSLGIAKLERLRIVGGWGYQSSLGDIHVFAGSEHAEQLGVREAGTALGAQWRGTQYAIGDVGIAFNVGGEYVGLRVRTNADLGGRLEITSIRSATGSFGVSIEHRRQQRDYYTTLGITSTIALEHRTEQRWTIAATIDQQLWDWLSIAITPDVQVTMVERFFDAPVTTSALTYVRRRLDEISGQLRAILVAQTSWTNHRVEFIVGSRDESNATFDRFSSPTPQLVEELRLSERMRDNQSRLVQIGTIHHLALRRRDTLMLVGQSRLVRYDTPSPLNYDDRDELALLGRLSYRRQWTDVLANTATFEYAATHFVFLRAQRSALSNWNRSFRLASTFGYILPAFQWYPSFEIIAQYTTYDFEGKSGVPTSFSFRQVSYRDSLRFVLASGSVEAQLYFRWFLRGDFSWSLFAEYPTGTGREQFLRGMYWRSSQPFSIGIGCRWYLLQQHLNAAALSQLSSSQQSIAPEAGIRLTLDAVLLELGGWYEVRTVNDGTRQVLPNLYLNLKRRL